jgi:hypothetical protein
MYPQVRLILLFMGLYSDIQEFTKKGVSEDIINLRFKHHLARLIDTLNRVLEERKRISMLY